MKKDRTFCRDDFSGDMMIRPEPGKLHVNVKEAKYLQQFKANGTYDAFCKSRLVYIL